MKFIEVTLDGEDFAFINVAHITMVESDDEKSGIITLTSGEILHVQKSYKAIKDDIEHFTKDA